MWAENSVADSQITWTRQIRAPLNSLDITSPQHSSICHRRLFANWCQLQNISLPLSEVGAEASYRNKLQSDEMPFDRATTKLRLLVIGFGDRAVTSYAKELNSVGSCDLTARVS